MSYNKGFIWYERYWLKNLQTADERQICKEKLIDIILKKNDIFDLIGNWDKAEYSYHQVIVLADAIGNKTLQANGKKNLGWLTQLKGIIPKQFQY